ncbi:MAG: DUF378 domain-containing protein [Rickettsiales bacterium]|jgi:uncharacterized membrane protein YuzA (DUF378 family)|nr:DUF378 domain-containing protein [Rickettsiales bacterium]
MRKLIDLVALPITLVGAVNYGLIGIFGLDLLSYLSGDLVQIAQIVIGACAVVVAAGFYAKR